MNTYILKYTHPYIHIHTQESTDDEKSEDEAEEVEELRSSMSLISVKTSSSSLEDSDVASTYNTSITASTSSNNKQGQSKPGGHVTGQSNENDGSSHRVNVDGSYSDDKKLVHSDSGTMSETASTQNSTLSTSQMNASRNSSSTLLQESANAHSSSNSSSTLSANQTNSSRNSRRTSLLPANIAGRNSTRMSASMPMSSPFKTKNAAREALVQALEGTLLSDTTGRCCHVDITPVQVHSYGGNSVSSNNNMSYTGAGNAGNANNMNIANAYGVNSTGRQQSSNASLGSITMNKQGSMGSSSSSYSTPAKNNTSFVVYEDEPGSLIAHSLSSREYAAALDEKSSDSARALQDGGSAANLVCQ
jgi:hypothetical protein